MVKSKIVTEKYLTDTLTVFKSDIKDELFEIKAEIISEIKDMREEFDTHQYSHTRINDELQEHDKSIKALETAKV